MANEILSLKNLKKAFGSHEVLKGIDFSVSEGEVISIIGSSGSGKSTILRCINLLEEATDGDIIFHGESVLAKDVKTAKYRAKVGMVFQQFNLFNNMTVLKNCMIGQMKVLKRSKEEARANAMRFLERVGMDPYINAKPAQLSGGMKQRVAIARALINKPKVLLLDEPLGALDLKLRKDMQNELKAIQKETGITFIYVTHDQEEALSMSDTVVVMADGHIQQIGTPQDIYNEPVNAFVADFIGESNIVDGVMLDDFKAKFHGHVFDCLDKGFEKNEAVDIVVRPEDVDVVSEEKGMLKGTVSSVTFKGVHYEIIVDIGGFKWMIQTTDYVGEGENIGLYIEPDAIHIMKKSEYSGMFGDYSSFSDEMDTLSDPEIEEDAEQED